MATIAPLPPSQNVTSLSPDDDLKLSSSLAKSNLMSRSQAMGPPMPQSEPNPMSQAIEPPAPQSALNLMSLPTELQLQIASYLTYPDALSLRHTSRKWYTLVYTGVNLKIEWLIERRRLHLDCPRDRACELGSDMKFCRGSVRLLMKRRREHGECDIRDGGRGCLVFGTRICTFRREESSTYSAVWKRVIGTPSNHALAWFIVAIIGVGIGLLWRYFTGSVGPGMKHE